MNIVSIQENEAQLTLTADEVAIVKGCINYFTNFVPEDEYSHFLDSPPEEVQSLHSSMFQLYLKLLILQGEDVTFYRNAGLCD